MFQFVTFNIRCDYEQDGKNNFRYRKALIKEKLLNESPDIICFQEVLPHVATWLKEELIDYVIAGCGRSENLRDEQVCIAFKKDRFNMIAFETFWLSETPYVPGSRYEEQSICPRTASEMILEDREEEKVFRIINTHLDHEGARARRLGVRQILEKIKEAKLFPDAPVLLTGDFNAPADGEELSDVISDTEFTNITEGIGVTFHSYGKEEEFESIDHIFIKNKTGVKEVLFSEGFTKWEDKKGEVWLSDHYPVSARIGWKKQ